nr:hypothetical protein [Tanacetum cinerariifolium]
MGCLFGLPSQAASKGGVCLGLPSQTASKGGVCLVLPRQQQLEGCLFSAAETAAIRGVFVWCCRGRQQLRGGLFDGFWQPPLGSVWLRLYRLGESLLYGLGNIWLRYTDAYSLAILNSRGTSLQNKKSVVNTKDIASVLNSKLNVKSDLQCVTCNGCQFSDNHDSCVLEFTNSVNARVKSKFAKKPMNSKI